MTPQDQNYQSVVYGRGERSAVFSSPSSVIANDGGFKLQDATSTKRSGTVSPVSGLAKHLVSKGKSLPSIPDDDDDDDPVDEDHHDEKDEDYEDITKVARSKKNTVKTRKLCSHPKNVSYLKNEGIPYQCSSAKDDRVKLRCLLHLPAGKSVLAPDVKWTRYETAKRRNPSGTPYRCPGMICVHQETKETTTMIAQFCQSCHVKNEKSSIFGG